MATTYVAPKAGAGVQARDFKPGHTWITSTFNIATAVNATDGGGAGGTAFVINDVVQMLKIPAGARVTDMVLSTSDIDTNVSPLITISVGDGSVTNRYINASTVGQTGGTVRMGSGITTNTMAFTYTVLDTIDLLIAAAPGTGTATGTLTLAVAYTTNL